MSCTLSFSALKALYHLRVTVSSVEPVEPEEAAPPPAPEAELEEGELPVNSWPPPAPPQLVIPTLAGPLPTPHTGLVHFLAHIIFNYVIFFLVRH
jgi:hypothetical protein